MTKKCRKEGFLEKHEFRTKDSEIKLSGINKTWAGNSSNLNKSKIMLQILDIRYIREDLNLLQY